MRNYSGDFASEIAALVEDILRKHGVIPGFSTNVTLFAVDKRYGTRYS